MTYGSRPRGDDPRWRESGAPDQETYAAWCARWCGMACLQMALLARDGAAPTLYELAAGCVEYGAYTDAPGRPRGLIYRPFAEYARDDNGQVTLHNPSGHVPEAVVATLPLPVFDRFAAHRGIALHR
jgi:hypothetical protein